MGRLPGIFLINLLLDTQALLWFLRDDSRLSSEARTAIEDPASLKFVSLVSGWEIAIKNSLGKLRLPLPFQELFPGQVVGNDAAFDAYGLRRIWWHKRITTLT